MDPNMVENIIEKYNILSPHDLVTCMIPIYKNHIFFCSKKWYTYHKKQWREVEEHYVIMLYKRYITELTICLIELYKNITELHNNKTFDEIKQEHVNELLSGNYNHRDKQKKKLLTLKVLFSGKLVDNEFFINQVINECKFRFWFPIIVRYGDEPVFPKNGVEYDDLIFFKNKHMENMKENELVIEI